MLEADILTKRRKFLLGISLAYRYCPYGPLSKSRQYDHGIFTVGHTLLLRTNNILADGSRDGAKTSVGVTPCDCLFSRYLKHVVSLRRALRRVCEVIALLVTIVIFVCTVLCVCVCLLCFLVSLLGAAGALSKDNPWELAVRSTFRRPAGSTPGHRDW